MNNTKQHRKGPLSQEEMIETLLHNNNSSSYTRGRRGIGASNKKFRTVQQSSHLNSKTEILRDLSPPKSLEPFSSQNSKLPASFGSTARKEEVSSSNDSSERILHSTYSFTTKHYKSNQNDMEKERISHRDAYAKLDDTFQDLIGRPQLESFTVPIDTLTLPPTRYGVRPPHKNTFNNLQGEPGTSFHIKKGDRFQTTQQTYNGLESNPLEEENRQKAMKSETKLQRLREEQQRALLHVQAEDQAKIESYNRSIIGKTQQQKAYLEAIAIREARGGVF